LRLFGLNEIATITSEINDFRNYAAFRSRKGFKAACHASSPCTVVDEDRLPEF
jgi:hypothetical protein